LQFFVLFSIIVVVAVGPSYFNNNQRRLLAIAFLYQPMVGVAGWLQLNPQADQTFFDLLLFKG